MTRPVNACDDDIRTIMHLQVTIRVGCPPFKIGTLAFTFTLAFDDGTEEFQGVKLNRYGMQVCILYTVN